MSIVQLFYCLPSGQFFGSWVGDPETDRNEFPELGYIEVPSAPESTAYFWDAQERAFVLPYSAEVESAWRDAELAATAWLRDRHRDQLEIGVATSLTAEQFIELLTYLQALRDWPQSEQFPETEHRPVAPPWIVEQTQ